MRLALAILPLLATPAFADAVNYRGTIGTRAVIIELTEPSDGAVAGRFAFLDEGKSIPLNPQSSAGDTFLLSEEGKCTPQLCAFDAEGAAISVPSIADWELTLDGTTLTGIRKGTAKTKQQTISAEQIGRHPLSGDPTPETLRDNAIETVFAYEGPIDPAKAPYEMALADVTLIQDRQFKIDDVVVSMMVDPRTKFAFPRVAFADGASADAINAILANAHAEMIISALDCLPTGYVGFGANQYTYDQPPSLGDYDSEMVDLSFANARLVSWTEAGSTYCQGAHPYNHFNSYTYDAQTGEPLDLSLIFSGWQARAYGETQQLDLEIARANPGDYDWYPDDALIGFVRDRIPADFLGDDGEDPELFNECYGEDALREQLDIRFAPGPQAVFTASGYPHVMSVCNGDLFSAPLAGLEAFLTPEAITYFE